MKSEHYTMIGSPFEANAPLKVDSVKIEWLEDEQPDLSWLEQDYSDVEDPKQRAKYLAQDKARLASYGDSWCSMGCMAVAVVSYPIGQGSRRLEVFKSSGLWGIESDCGPEYRAEVEAEQMDDLRNHLAQFNIALP